MSAIGQSELETWRLILLDQQRREIKVIANDVTSTISLPEVEIPYGQRIAESLTKAVRDLLHLNTLCLFIPTLCKPNEARYAVMETLPAPDSDSNCRSITLHELVASSFQNQDDFLGLQQALTELDNREIDSASPFIRQGWFEDARNWIADCLHPVQLALTGDFDQLNGSESFSLIRFETDGPDVWFKAVGEPNLREFPITLELSRRLPKYLPTIIGERADWNGWLALSAGPKSLVDTTDLGSWEAAVRTLADLQIDSIEGSDALLQADAHDLRTDKLAELVQPFLEVVSRLMQQQTKLSPSPLAPEDLELLGLRLQDATTLLEDLRIPHTLGHLDLNPGNIFPADEGCKFLDWAEAYVGHPFFSFEYLSAHRRRTLGSTEVESSLLAAYAQRWARVLSEEVIAEAFAFIPLVAVFAYAVSLPTWKDDAILCDPNVAGYIRSLARRMNREAVQLLDRRTLCLS